MHIGTTTGGMTLQSITGGNLGINPVYPQPAPHRCPNCGACPNCGRYLAPPRPFVPWPNYPQPYIGDPWPYPGTDITYSAT